MNLILYRIAAIATVGFAIAACGGSSTSTTSTAETSSPTSTIGGSQVTLGAYSSTRAASAPPELPSAEAQRTALALALPPLQETLNTPSGPVAIARSAIVFPAVQASRLDVLRAAAAGDTLTELSLAMPPDSEVSALRSLTKGISRTLWAPAPARFARSFLSATDTGSSPGSSWRAVQVEDWTSHLLELTDFGDVSKLNLRQATRLVVGHSFLAEAPVNGQVEAFLGVGVASADYWYTAPMLALAGPGGTLRGEDHLVVATWIGHHLWVSVRPLGNEPLFRGLPPSSLSAALSAAWLAYPTPQGLVSSSRQVWPQLTGAIEDRSQIPSGISLPYSEARANLSGLDGGGTYLTEVARSASLQIALTGLRASGAQAMAFSFSPENLHGGGSFGAGSTSVTRPRPQNPPDCPRSEADWRGAYLAIFDRTGHLLLVASLPDARNSGSTCYRR